MGVLVVEIVGLILKGIGVSELAVEIQVVHVESDADLPEVAEAGNTLAFGFGLGQRRQQHRGQDGDDGDDHEQLDQGEPGLPGSAIGLDRDHASEENISQICSSAINKNENGRMGGASRQYHQRIGARPLGCRNAGFEGASELIGCSQCFARFCSLKAALRCRMLALVAWWYWQDAPGEWDNRSVGRAK